MSPRRPRPVVLLVDDSRNNRLLMGMALAEEYLVLAAESGAEALALAARERVDILVTDLRMPGMSGLELAAQMLERYPKVPRLIFTASAATAELAEAARTGLVAEVLTKPLAADHVAARISARLGQAEE